MSCVSGLKSYIYNMALNLKGNALRNVVWACFVCSSDVFPQIGSPQNDHGGTFFPSSGESQFLLVPPKGHINEPARSLSHPINRKEHKTKLLIVDAGPSPGHTPSRKHKAVPGGSSKKEEKRKAKEAEKKAGPFSRSSSPPLGVLWGPKTRGFALKISRFFLQSVPICFFGFLEVRSFVHGFPFFFSGGSPHFLSS